jgi:outer membrane protein TolC
LERRIEIESRKNKYLKALQMDRKLKIYLLMSMLLIWSGTRAQEVPHIPELDDYLQMAAVSNPRVQAKYKRFEMTIEKIAQSNGLPDPTLSFGYFVQPIETRVGPQQAKLSLTQMFPWFGSLKANTQRDSLLAQASYQEFLETKYQLYYEVKSAYYPIYELHQTILLHQENIEILESFKKVSTVKYENGIGSMVDVIRVDILLENAQTEIRVLKAKKYPLQVRFNRLLNRADSIEVFIPWKLKPKESIAIQKDNFIAKNPVLRAYELQMKSAKAQETVARKQGNPMIGVGLDYMFVGNSTGLENSGKDAFMPMVSMTLPIYRKKYKSAIREAQLHQTAIELEYQNYENLLWSEYEMAKYNLETALQNLSLYDRQIKNTEMAIKILMVSYSNSGKDFEEVLRMQQELLEYQKAHVIALKDYYVALARIKYVIGNPFP